jgi:hexokinase
MINEKGVVFGAGYNSNFQIEHKYVDKIEDLDELRGSKYI